MNDDLDKKAFWHHLLIAAEAPPQKANFVRGVSQIEHPILAVGVDEDRRRVILISAEQDARSAAIAQQDIQQALTDYKIIMARPIAVNLAKLAQIFEEALGVSEIDLKQLGKGNEEQNVFREVLESSGEPKISKLLNVFESVDLNAVGQWFELIRQLSTIINGCVRAEDKTFKINLRKIGEMDPADIDRRLGLCSIPLYDFGADEIETIQSGANIDSVRSVFRKHHLLQYFFPSPDHLALGLIERGGLKPRDVLAQMNRAPDLGHPLATPEFLTQEMRIGDMIDAIEERGLAVEGEIGLEITEKGQNLRATVKFKPREGIVSKIANNTHINLDLKDLFKMGS
jgi:hypothetical protein